MAPTRTELRHALGEVSLADEARLGRRLRRARPDELDDLAARIESARAATAARRATVPEVRYPPELPITERVDELRAALDAHQVVVVAGETGSGKSTQLPKICLDAGRGVRGMIGHTQPRRLAARSVAERVADELGVELGGPVGYAVRFADEVGDDTLVKVMTDGLLLAELRGDPALRRYDTIIVDEAHERSLNIDFLLGYLARLLPRRPDLRLVVTSATIDTARFAEHFGGAPVIEVSGRTWPVEIRYRPIEGDGRDQTDAVVDAVRELAAEGPGDVLVFCSGERDIRDAAVALERARLPHTEVLPLYARLPASEQHKVFAAHTGRRVVLATNVAETSLTVPGIRGVVDPGTARISRFNRRTKVQRLPIEPISQASADQRAGRCGRVGPGTCIRLYSPEDLAARPRFTEPEILRTNLASVVLSMAALGLGEVEDFPFLDPPDRRAVGDAVAVLVELGALEPAGSDGADRASAHPGAVDASTRSGPRLTPLGRSLARLPVDPRLGRMILAAEANGCVEEAIVVAAGLTVADPRRRPEGEESRADALHRRFEVPDSDLSSLLALWRYLARTQRELGSSAWRRRLRDEMLDPQRVREWQDLVRQLREVVHDLGIARSSRPEDADALHRSVLAGLLSQVGMRDPEARDYRGTRQSRFVLGRSSVLHGRAPAWVMAAELVETDRLRAHRAARIDPGWIEPLAGHLVRVHHGEARWDPERGAAVVDERVTLYGLPVVTGRPVAYERVDPAGAHALFVRHGLCRAEGVARRAVHDALDDALDELARLEDRLRRGDLVPDEDELVDLLVDRLPATVTSRAAFDRWWRDASPARRAGLAPTAADLAGGRVDPGELAGLPDELDLGAVTAPLTYLFAPGEVADGVVAHVSLAALGALDVDRLGWGVPGRRRELVTALLRELPKDLRRRLGPAPEVAGEVLDDIDPADGPLPVVLAAALRDRFDVPVEAAHLDPGGVDAYLRPIVQVEGPGGESLAWGRDVAALVERLGPEHERLVAAVGRGLRRDALTGWPDIDPLPATVTGAVDGYEVTGYPALVDEGDTVGVRVLPDPERARRAMSAGTRRLLVLAAGDPHRALARRLGARPDLVGLALPGGGLDEIVAESVEAAVDRIVRAEGGPARDAAGFERLVVAVRARVEGLAGAVAGAALDAVVAADRLHRRLAALPSASLDDAVVDMTDQLHRLVPAHLVARTGVDRLGDLARYLRGVERRIDTLGARAARDAPAVARIVALERRFAAVRSRLDPRRWGDPDVEAVRWSLEELRISLLAQVVGARGRVSEARVAAAIEDLAAGARRDHGSH